MAMVLDLGWVYRSHAGRQGIEVTRILDLGLIDFGACYSRLAAHAGGFVHLFCSSISHYGLHPPC